MYKATKIPCFNLCVLVALTLGLEGCGRSTRGAATLVVAKVNDREITMVQLSRALDTTSTAQFGARSRKTVLAELVDEELLFQEAIAAKLDRDPDVLLDIDRSRRRTLGRAYLERTVYAQQVISAAEKRKYYDDNALLFAHRRVFHVATFNTEEKALSAALKDDLTGAHTVDAVQETLSRHNVSYELDECTVAPEDLPQSLLPDFAAAAAGDVIAAPLEDGTIQLIAIMGVVARPLGFNQASGRIEAFLRTRRNEIARNDYVATIRARAKVAYIGIVAGAEGTR